MGSIETREQWIDNIKGLGILFVMYGHVVVVNNRFYSWVTMFHIQVFLMLSGYLYATKNTSFDDIKRKVYKIGFIYFRFSIIAIMANMLWNLWHDINVVKYFIFDFYKTISLYGIFALWYLTSYIIASAIFLLAINKFKKQVFLAIFVVVCVTLGVIAYLLLNTLSEYVGTSLYAIISFPIVAFFRSLVAVLYIYIGWCIKKKQILERLKRYMIIPVGGCLLIVSYIFSGLSPNRNFSTLTFGDRPIIYLIGSVLGATGIIILFHGIKTKIVFLNFFGKSSLIILITHMSLRLHNISQAFCALFVTEEEILYGVLSLLFLSLLEIPIIYFLNGPLKWSLDIPKKDRSQNGITVYMKGFINKLLETVIKYGDEERNEKIKG